MASVSVILMTVSREEADMIEAARADASHKAHKAIATLEVLEVAYGYADWLNQKALIDSYSVYSDYVQYRALELAPSVAYKIVRDILKMARERVYGVLDAD